MSFVTRFILFSGGMSASALIATFSDRLVTPLPPSVIALHAATVTCALIIGIFQKDTLP